MIMVNKIICTFHDKFIQYRQTGARRTSWAQERYLFEKNELEMCLINYSISGRHLVQQCGAIAKGRTLSRNTSGVDCHGSWQLTPSMITSFRPMSPPLPAGSSSKENAKGMIHLLRPLAILY